MQQIALGALADADDGFAMTQCTFLFPQVDGFGKPMPVEMVGEVMDSGHIVDIRLRQNTKIRRMEDCRCLRLVGRNTVAFHEPGCQFFYIIQFLQTLREVGASSAQVFVPDDRNAAIPLERKDNIVKYYVQITITNYELQIIFSHSGMIAASL